MQSMRFTTAALRTGTMAILAALVGVVCALVWANLAVLPSYVVQADGHAIGGRRCQGVDVGCLRVFLGDGVDGAGVVLHGASFQAYAG